MLIKVLGADERGANIPLSQMSPRRAGPGASACGWPRQRARSARHRMARRGTTMRSSSRATPPGCPGSTSLRLGRLAADADRQPSAGAEANTGSSFTSSPAKSGRRGTAPRQQAPARLRLVRHMERGHVDHQLAAEDGASACSVARNRINAWAASRLARQPEVKGDRMPLVLDWVTPAPSSSDRRATRRAPAGPQRPGGVAAAPAAEKFLGAMVADDESGFEAESSAHVLDAAAGHDRHRKLGCQRGQACRDSLRQARIVRGAPRWV